MAYLASHWRIYAALLVSCALVVGAYVVAKGVSSTPVAEAFTETALLQAIATKDTSGDGLPDWEKALYGIPIDSTTTDYFHLGMTDGEAVAKGLIVPRAIADVPAAPTASSTTNSGINYAADGLTPPTQGSLTDTFAKSFFTSYLAAKQQNGGVDLSVTDTQTIANQALNSLAISVASAPDFKSINDLTISESGADALRAFAADAEAVLHKNVSTATTTELVYLQYAVEGNDAAARSRLASIATAYRNTAAGLAALPVPRELATDDLVLINAMMQMSGIIGDFSRVNTDPLSAMLALQQYPQVAQSFAQAYTNIASIYATAGIVLPTGTPGAAFVNMMANVSAQQP
ncbi:MAG: hypothetical protein KGI71_02840 [Patescibacteria group bacterium]|nr:hypothetical protein [Patescibacteria group bacterium]